MLERLQNWFDKLDGRLRRSIGTDISTPGRRRRAWMHFQFLDHAFLRNAWTNFDKVADGVYRSNHPSPGRLELYRDMGIRGVLNLRGDDGASPWLFEKEACERLGLDLRVAKIYARRPAKRREILALIDTMRAMPKPFVMHCKSGADRAGFAAALYKAVIEGAPIAEARKQLALKYVHFDWTATGIVDHILDMYEARNAESPISMEDWLRTEYDHKVARESFAAKQARRS